MLSKIKVIMKIKKKKVQNFQVRSCRKTTFFFTKIDERDTASLLCLHDANIGSKKHILKSSTKEEAAFQYILMLHKFFRNTKNVQGFTFSNRFSGGRKHEAQFHE